MNLRIITNNHADDSKIGFTLKNVFKAEWTHESMPTAWELKKIFESLNSSVLRIFRLNFFRIKILNALNFLGLDKPDRAISCKNEARNLQKIGNRVFFRISKVMKNFKQSVFFNCGQLSHIVHSTIPDNVQL